ncbi:MAG: hypothetical protein EXR53_05880, partial [Dehalococcoidia bacterium]|nr:hypothetical protein [Dehalococcoidia bacterium]
RSPGGRLRSPVQAQRSGGKGAEAAVAFRTAHLYQGVDAFGKRFGGRSGWRYGTGIQLIVRAIIFVAPVFLIAIFTTQADVVDLASTWLRLQVISAFFMGMSMVFQQSFNGVGDTFAPMVVIMLAVWLVEVPLAWTFSHTMGVGPLGVGYANIVGMASRFALYVPYFFWGRWLRVKVI